MNIRDLIKNNPNKEFKIKYRVRNFIDKYSCIDRYYTTYLTRCFIPKNTSVLYGYIDRYNIKSYSLDDIMEIAIS
jgi:hypothetical protein